MYAYTDAADCRSVRLAHAPAVQSCVCQAEAHLAADLAHDADALVSRHRWQRRFDGIFALNLIGRYLSSAWIQSLAAMEA